MHKIVGGLDRKKDKVGLVVKPVERLEAVRSACGKTFADSHRMLTRKKPNTADDEKGKVTYCRQF